jgi:hypothetical protein
VATVSEVRAALSRANHLIAEAQSGVQQVAGKLGEAKVLIDWIRETSVDTLGAPQIGAALEMCEQQVAPLLTIAIEQNSNYGATL